MVCAQAIGQFSGKTGTRSAPLNATSLSIIPNKIHIDLFLHTQFSVGGKKLLVHFFFFAILIRSSTSEHF